METIQELEKDFRTCALCASPAFVYKHGVGVCKTHAEKLVSISENNEKLWSGCASLMVMSGVTLLFLISLVIFIH